MLAIRTSMLAGCFAAAATLMLAVVARAVAPPAASVVAAPTAPAVELPAVDPPPPCMPPTVEIDPAPVYNPPSCELSPRAVELYRAGRFADAAGTMAASCPDAELLATLASAWQRGVVRPTSAIGAFEALAVARRYDLALGSAHADVIVRAIRRVVSTAARDYVARHDADGVALAVVTARELGVHDATLDAAVRWADAHDAR